MPSPATIPSDFWPDTIDSWIARRLPPGRDLARPELSELAAAVAAEPRLWRPHVRHDAERRHYVQLYRDAHVDVWLLCWTNQQDTGFHDHDVSSGAVHVVDGDLLEDRFEMHGDLIRRLSVERPRGATFDFDASHVHAVKHPQERPPATSVHVYSPPLWRMGYYEAGENGLLQRSSVTYAEETTTA
jgi:hypothetical protein